MSAPDPYATHALLIVYGADRAEIARQLRDQADSIEQGAGDYTADDAIGVRIVRRAYADPVACGEEASYCRMHAVYSAEGDGSKPIALFADEEMALGFSGATDRCVLRADVCLSVWNSHSPDPHAVAS